MNEVKTVRKNLDILDVTKFILSFFVVAIHAEGLPSALYPWLRIAVPLFFVISSFLLFFGIQGKDSDDQKRAIVRYVKRNFILYAVWFVLLLPFTYIARRSWFDDGILLGIFRFLRGLILGSTFRASWFITAGVLAVLLIYAASHKIPRSVLTVGAALCYLVCCLVTSYRGLVEGTPFSVLLDVSKHAFDGMATSFVHALFWVMLGKLFAENRIRISSVMAAFGCCVGAVLLYVEYWLTSHYLQAASSASCYMTLIPFTLCLFAWLIRINRLQIRFAKKLRNVSTLIYVSHCAVLTCFSVVIDRLLDGDFGVLIYFLSCISVTVIGFLLVNLSEKKGWAFFKKLW